MSAVQIVRCPNCGSFAERQVLSDRRVANAEQVVQTACPVCDYLMVMGLSTGRVIEAHSPGQPGQSHDHNPIADQPRFLVHTV